jgi:hypothetical protein
MTQEETAEVHVLYIAGIGRSGSTLLCRTLGTLEGWFGTGELMRILSRGLINGDLCSCGVPVVQCGQWREVLAEFGSLHPDLDPVRMERIRRRVTEGWDIVRHVLLPRRLSGLEEDLREYQDFLSALYRSIHKATGAQVIVDASKNPVFLRLLIDTPGIKVSVVHLIRDSRGYAHSLRRSKQRPGTNGRREMFARYGAFLSSTFWSLSHLAVEAWSKKAHRVVRLRYEDFASAPERTLRKALDELSLPADTLSTHVSRATVRLDGDHLIASNPNRALRGEVEIRADLEWRKEMNGFRRSMVTGLTFPLLRRYGYLPRPMARSPSRAAARPIVVREPES